MIEELAVGAQYKLPYLHVVVNNSYLGLIRQSQRGFEMDFEVSLGFDNINAPASVERLRRRPRRGRRGPGLQGDPRARAGRDRAGVRTGASAGWRSTRCRWCSSSSSSASPTSRWAPRSTTSTSSRSSRRRSPSAGRADGGRRCSMPSSPDAERDRMPRFAANLTMLFNEHDFLDRFARRRAPTASRRSSILFPYAVPARSSWPTRSTPTAWRRCCTTCRPATGTPASAASPAIPTASASSATASARAIDYATALGCPQVNCLAGIAPAGRRRGRGARRPSSTTCASPRRELERGRHQAADRADQHARHPGLLPEPHRRRRSRSSTRSARTTCFSSTTSTTRSSWKAILRATLPQRLRTASRHVQLADNPGRNEPGTGEINYPVPVRAPRPRAATRAGSAASTSRRPRPRQGLGWFAALSRPRCATTDMRETTP